MTITCPASRASTIFFLPLVTSRCTVPREIPICSPASAWVMASRSQREMASSSSASSSTFCSCEIGVPTGLNIWSVGRRDGQHLLGFLGLGDMVLFLETIRPILWLSVNHRTWLRLAAEILDHRRARATVSDPDVTCVPGLFYLY